MRSEERSGKVRVEKRIAPLKHFSWKFDRVRLGSSEGGFYENCLASLNKH